MLLSGALLALFLTGFWLYCLTDAILTPALECRGLSKPAWVAVIAVTFVAGALAWLLVRRPARDELPPDGPGYYGYGWAAADDSGTGQRAGRRRAEGRPARPGGPDDDPEFLRALGAAIRRNPPVS
jgi:hypothetical protein